MKKSLLASVLSLSLAMAVTVPAFAATPTDVAGVKEQSAIEELVALGIINGYTDGTFKPGNNITRAELAKIIVIATGSEQAATALQNVKSQFKDVKTNEWYTGYINVAAGKGLLLGDKGTKNFRPNANIKFEEVAAIVIRALGYQDSNLTGAWPYNVTLKAEEVGIFKKVDLALGTSATRGVVAQQVSNALGENIVEWNADSKLYSNATDRDGNALILISRLGTTSNQVISSAVLDTNGKVVLNGVPKTLSSNFIITGGKKLSDLLAHNVTVLADADGKVRAITDNQKEDNVVTGKLNVDFNNALQVEVKIGTAVTKYDTVGGSVYYLNSDSAVASDFPLKKDSDVSVFLYDNTKENREANPSRVGKVRAVVVSKANAADALFDSYVAATTTAKARVLTQSNVSVTVDDATSITINGEAKAATDLVKNDVLDIVYNKDRAAVKITATRNVVEGKVTAKSTQADGTAVYTVDGKTYTVVTGALTGSKALTVDASYKLFLNKDGKVAGAELLTGGTSELKYAIVLNADNNVTSSGAFSSTKDVLKYYSIKENKALEVSLNKDTFAIAGDVRGNAITTIKTGDDVENTSATAAFNIVAAPIFVEWVLKNTDNSINGVKNDQLAPTPLTTLAEIDAKTDTSLKIIENGRTKTYEINANTVVLDATKAVAKAPGDREISTSTLANLTVGNKVTVITDGPSAFAKYVVITQKSASSAKEAKYGLFVSASQNGDDYSVTINVKGTDETHALTGSEGKKIFDQIKATNPSVAGSVYNADSRTLVALTDTFLKSTDTGYATAPSDYKEASTGYDTLQVFTATQHIDLVDQAATSLSDSTLKLAGSATKYYVNSTTAVYVYDKTNNTLTTNGIFADVTAYAGETDLSKYALAVVGDDNYGSYTLAKAIVLVKLK